jgi:hypothetical protein
MLKWGDDEYGKSTQGANGVMSRVRIYRDMANFIKKLQISKESSIGMRYIGDTLSFIGFQLPLYWLSMMFGRAELTEMVSASVTLTIIAGFLPFRCYFTPTYTPLSAFLILPCLNVL